MVTATYLCTSVIHQPNENFQVVAVIIIIIIIKLCQYTVINNTSVLSERMLIYLHRRQKVYSGRLSTTDGVHFIFHRL